MRCSPPGPVWGAKNLRSVSPPRPAQRDHRTTRAACSPLSRNSSATACYWDTNFRYDGSQLENFRDAHGSQTFFALADHTWIGVLHRRRSPGDSQPRRRRWPNPACGARDLLSGPHRECGGIGQTEPMADRLPLRTRRSSRGSVGGEQRVARQWRALRRVDQASERSGAARPHRQPAERTRPPRRRRPLGSGASRHVRRAHSRGQRRDLTRTSREDGTDALASGA